ncbi:hypothetical protein [Deinococcus arcticus]|uniref:hypothetical protein n=1 Tax=Deinococcus arcticus TaxID=2136176 RepID=UPI0011B20F80|nr:hypothetical protein [Deinococcus arcticus]
MKLVGAVQATGNSLQLGGLSLIEEGRGQKKMGEKQQRCVAKNGNKLLPQFCSVPVQGKSAGTWGVELPGKIIWRPC